MIGPGFEGLFKEFELEAQERLGHIESLLLDTRDYDSEQCIEVRESIRKDLHTLKGNSAMMGFAELQQIAHDLEDTIAMDADGFDIARMLDGLDVFRRGLARAKGKPKEVPEPEVASTVAETRESAPTQESVRVSFEALDELMQQVSDMVILRNRLTETVDYGRRLDDATDNFAVRNKEAWNDTRLAHDALIQTLDYVQDCVMQLRMVPLKTLFRSLNRIVHDETQNAGKNVRLRTAGGDTPLDRALLESANEVLGHLVRNAVVHGIERANEREATGKPPRGTVRVVAETRGDAVRIEVADDGAGIDLGSVVDAACARGIDTKGQCDPYSVLFVPGFSTKAAADLSAGRGVGLAAVQETVQRQNGQISVSSEVGKGTVFALDLPLSASITRSLMLVVDDEEYALPMINVLESRRFKPGDRHTVNNASVLRWRDRLVPLLDLGNNFGTASVARDGGFAVLVQAAGKLRALAVDGIRGIQEVVVNSLGPILGNPRGIAGTTVLGDGRAILILDARALVEVEPFVGKQA